MSSYQIQPYTFKAAEKLGVRIRPSLNPKKKIDVLDWNNEYITSIGDIMYADYPTYLALGAPKAYADIRRRLYHTRHMRDASVIGSRSYYSAKLLW
jgi:hypothetical protein